MHPHIIQFAKAPVLGQVKTRLSPYLSQEKSLALHRHLVAHIVETMLALPECKLELWLTSKQNFGDFSFARLENEIPLYCQQGESLGERLHEAIVQCLTRTNKFAVIGSDCPFIDKHYMQEVWQALKQHDLVLGPATDGGYVLLAAKQCYPGLFDDIEWGSEKVFAQTLSKAKQLGLSCYCPEPLSDIDRPEDLSLIDHLFTL